MMANPISRRILLRCRASIAWLRAFEECLKERRPVSIIKTQRELRGYLL